MPREGSRVIILGSRKTGTLRYPLTGGALIHMDGEPDFKVVAHTYDRYVVVEEGRRPDRFEGWEWERPR